jgi:hypothetical protein
MRNRKHGRRKFGRGGSESKGSLGRYGMRSRRGFEKLEDRRLLAGDVHGPAGVDPILGYYTPEEIEAFENVPFDSDYSSKTRPPGYDGGEPIDALTFVLDFKSPTQGTTSDIFNNQISFFDVTEFGFAASDFDMVTTAIYNEVIEDYFDELVGTVAGPIGEELNVNFIMGDIGTPPVGITEFYFIQIGTGIAGPHTGGGILGVAGGSVVRDENGIGPNFGIEVGDVVGSMFTDIVVTLGGLTPANALTSGNLEFTTAAVAGTTSHEVAHTISLSHVANAGSVQPTPGAFPIMGTGAIDLPNQSRITDREFSLAGVDPQNGGAPRQHVQQLVNALGLRNVMTGVPSAVATSNDILFTTNNDQNIRVTYTHPQGVSIAELGTGDIRVVGPNGYSEIATFVSVDDTADGTPRVGRYTVPPPLGNWGPTASGNYLIELLPNEVLGTDGSPIPGGVIGTFLVDVPLPLGPDGFGYTASGTRFQFQDISSTGNFILEEADDAFEEITPGNGFEFSFYGVPHESFVISSNGLITFEESSTVYENSDFLTEPADQAIAVLWDDLDASAGQGVYWQLVGSGDQQSLIIQWETNYFTSDDPISFQAILNEADNSIQVNYRDLDGGSSTSNEGFSATLGLKNSGAQGTDVLIANFNLDRFGFVGSSRSVLFQKLNRVPTDILLSTDMVLENIPADSVVATLSTADLDRDESFTYELVEGDGDWDNGLFTIEGDSLRILESPDFETQPAYFVRIKSTDIEGASIEKEFMLTVIDQAEVDSIIVAGGADQRSRVDQVRVTFDGPVALADQAFAVYLRGDQDAAVVTNVVTELDDQGRSVATLTFSGPLTRNGALVDGNFLLELDPNRVARFGQPFAVLDSVGTRERITFGDDEADGFYAMFGDVNGDRSLEADDYAAFRGAYGKQIGDVGYDLRFDFDADGVVGEDDFGQLRARFGSSFGFE